MFDPNAPMPSFDVQTASLERQRKLADFLRERSAKAQMPEGQMVSGHYVRPSFTQYLGPLLDKLQGGMAERKYAEQAGQLKGAQQEAANVWRAGIPQATPAVPGITDAQRAESILNDQPHGPVAQPAQPLTRQAILKYTMAGLNNPQTADEAKLVNQSLTADLARGEDKDFRAEEARKTEEFRASEAALTRQQRADEALQRLQQQQEVLAQRAQDATLNREQRADLARMNDETKRALAAASREASAAARAVAQGLAANGKSLAEQRLDETIRHNNQSDIEKYATRIKDLVPLHQSMKAVQDIFDSYDNDYTKIPGLGYSTLLSPVARKQEANRVQRQVKAFANAVTRGQAGLSQTLSEQANVDLETMASGKFSTQEFMRSWPEIMAKYNSMMTGAKGSLPPTTMKEYLDRGGYDIGEVHAKPKGKKSALPKTTATPATANGLTAAEQAELDALRQKFPGAGK